MYLILKKITYIIFFYIQYILLILLLNFFLILITTEKDLKILKIIKIIWDSLDIFYKIILINFLKIKINLKKK